MKIKRYLTIILILVSLLISGCEILLLKEAPITITIWHPFEKLKAEGVQFAVDSYMELNPMVTIAVQKVPFDQLLYTYQDAVANDQGPNIFIGADDWGPELDIADLILPLTGVNIEELNQASIATGLYLGYQIGVPYSLEGVILYRNSSLQPESASSYTDLVEKANAVSSGDTYGAILEVGHLYSLAHLNAIGGLLMTNEGLPAFNSPEAVQWIDMLIEFTEMGADTWYGDNDLAKFKAGEAGWIIDGTWNYTDIYGALGDDLEIDLWPEGMSGYVMADMIYLNPNSSTAESKVSKEFIQYLIGSDSQTASSLFDPNFIPVNMTVEPTNTNIKAIMEALSGGVSWIAKPEMDAYWGPMETAILAVLDDGTEPLIALQLALDLVNAAIGSQGE